MTGRVDLILADGQRRRATATQGDDQGIVLVFNGITLAPGDTAMRGARVVVGDADICQALRVAGYNAVQPDSVVVTAKLSQTQADAMRMACKANSMAMSAALACAVDYWLAAGCPCGSKSRLS